MSTLDLEALKELAGRATAGPWHTLRGGSSVFVRNEGGRVVATDRKPYFESHDDEDAATAAFIAASREAVPALIAEVERLREALGRTKEAILSDVNGLAIQCTIWMPCPGVAPTETLVDFIDAALSPTPPADKEC